MKIAIMQPYFFPYIGYFQLMNAVDEFIIYDNIEFTKKGWINRNRILVNGVDSYITLPLKKDSDYLDVKSRYLADNWNIERKKILNRISEAYKKAPPFAKSFQVIEEAVLCNEMNLFKFILNTLKIINKHLEIKTPLIISSSIPIDYLLKAEKKVIELCKARKASTYINTIGGLMLYDKNEFNREGINLQFLKTDTIIYPQFKNDFVSLLSIIDVMMFNSKEQIQKYLQL